MRVYLLMFAGFLSLLPLWRAAPASGALPHYRGAPIVATPHGQTSAPMFTAYAFQPRSTVAGLFSTLAVSGTFAYLLSEFPTPHLLVFDTAQPTQPTLVGTLPLPALGTLAVVGKTVYVAVRSTGVIYIVDAHAPQHPQLHTTYQATAPIAHVELRDQRAYLFGQGLTILSIYDPLMPVLLGRASPDLVVDTGQIVADRAYLQNSGSVTILDIRDATQIRTVGQFQTAYTRDIAVDGTLVYLLGPSIRGEPARFSVVDVRDPSMPVYLTTVTQPGHTRMVIADGLAYLFGNSRWQWHVYDISNPQQPQLVGVYDQGYANELQVSGNYVYALGIDGFRILERIPLDHVQFLPTIGT